ncbi:MAG: hypothetical protein RH862_00380 [Leptospiraceae bacterium]
MATKRDRKLPSEYRGPERAFQFDRDTFLIYTGIHDADMRPFSRIGAGTSVPAGLLPQIENVVVPEENLWNVGLEAAWLKESLAAGSGHIRYVGSKERTTQLHRYLDPNEDEMSGSKEDAGNDPVEYSSYSAPEKGVSQKDRCTITYMATGEYQVTVGGSRVLDSQSLSRGRMGLDREYEQVNKILSKQGRRMEHGWSFFPLQTDGDMLSVYWGLQGKGLALNPPVDVHYHFLANAIDPERLQMVIAETAELPGLAEQFRRNNTLERQFGAYCPEMERIIHLKRMYNRAQVKTFDDSRTLPFSKETVFFCSRSKSHGAFAMKANPEAEYPMQIIFPLQKGKQSRSFDFTKGPFDLEIMRLEEGQKFEGAGSYLTLIGRGHASPKKFSKSKLKGAAFPLLSGSEYRLQQIVNLSNLADELSLGLKGSEFEQTVPELLSLMGQSGPNLDEEAVLDLLYRIRTQAVPDNILLRINLGEATRAVHSYLGTLKDKFPKVAKLSEKVFKRYSTDKLKVRDLEALEGAVAFDVYAVQARISILQVRPVHAPRIAIVFPPEIDTIKAEQKEYRKYLKEQNRILDKGDESPSERATLEFLEKLLEERLHLAEERERLGDLLQDLDLSGPVEDKGDLPFHMKLPYWLRRTFEFLRIPEFVEWVKGLFGGGSNREKGSLTTGLSAWLLIPLAAVLLGLLGLGLYATTDNETGENSVVTMVKGWFSSDEAPESEDPLYLTDSSSTDPGTPEVAGLDPALSIAAPGGIQENRTVPGEEDVQVTDQEVFQFSNLLARRNGFAALREQDPDLRNPDLVFPGDRLNLPDGRILQITPGEYIWEISRKQYRKDMARLQILDRQVRNLGQEYQKKKSLMS